MEVTAMGAIWGSTLEEGGYPGYSRSPRLVQASSGLSRWWNEQFIEQKSWGPGPHPAK